MVLSPAEDYARSMGMDSRPKRRPRAPQCVRETVRVETDALSAAGVRTHHLQALAAARAIALAEAQMRSPEKWRRLKEQLRGR